MSLAGGKLVLDHPAEAVARLTLSNPEKRNALDHEILDALAEVLPRLDRGIEIRCVIITGAGEIFSAGYDIAGIPDETFASDAEALVAHPFHAAMEAVSAHPYPVVAAINGHCLGGGLELAVRCDLRLCATRAKLGMPPAKLGLIYGHTGLRRFIDVVGVARTKELFLTGRNLSAPRAWRSAWCTTPSSTTSSRPPPSSWPPRSPPTRRSRRGEQAGDRDPHSFARLTEEQERELIELRRSCFDSEDFREGIRPSPRSASPSGAGVRRLASPRGEPGPQVQHALGRVLERPARQLSRA